MDKTRTERRNNIAKIVEKELRDKGYSQLMPSKAGYKNELDRIERKLDGMSWVLVERMINEMAIELLRHVEFIKRKPTIKIEDAKDALRKIYSKYQGKHEKNVRTL